MNKAPKDLVHMLKITYADFNMKLKTCNQIIYLFRFFFLQIGIWKMNRFYVSRTDVRPLWVSMQEQLGLLLLFFFTCNWSILDQPLEPFDQHLDQSFLLLWIFLDVDQPPTKIKKKDGTPNTFWACGCEDAQALERRRKRGREGRCGDLEGFCWWLGCYPKG